MLQQGNPSPRSIINGNHGPIIQLKKDNSERSLYSQNQIDSPLKIDTKIVSNILTKNQQRSAIKSNKKIALDNVVQMGRNLSNSKQKNNTMISNKEKLNQRYNNKQMEQKINENIFQLDNKSLGGFKRSGNYLKSKQISPQNNIPQKLFKHQYINYKSKHSSQMMNLAYQSLNNYNQSLNQNQNDRTLQMQSPRSLLKFQEHALLRNANRYEKQDIQKQIMNGANSIFGQVNSVNFPSKTIAEDLQNRTLRSSQGGRWLRSQVYMQENEKKMSLQESLIKNYHKHESKYVSNLQKYLKAFSQFEQNLLRLNFNISLMQPLQDIKIKMQAYMQKILRLQNLPIDKPSGQWTQSQLTKFFTNYESIYIPQQSINSKNQSLTLKKYKNCVYFGHISSQGKKEGFGIIYYFNGKIFEGIFKSDQKMQGFQMDQSQDQIYVGMFDKGLRHGEGIMKNNQYLLWGKWSNNQFTTSISTETQNSFLKQQLLKNERNDEIDSKFGLTHQSFMKNKIRMDDSKSTIKKQGFKLSFKSLIVYYQQLLIYKNETNDLYIGGFKENSRQKHGQGVEIFVNGDLYIGNYQNNSPQGYGQYYWSSGAYYRGQFMSGMRHGKGKWHMLHGDMYEGDYMNDKKNGKGTYLWKNGSKYIGSFQNDYRHGYGEMHWNDGRSYKGEWLNGIQKNVRIKLDKGIDKSALNSSFNHPVPTTSLHAPPQKKAIDTKRNFLPGVTKKTFRSTSNPNTRQSFHTIASSNHHNQVKKKIAIENIKALYNPSNY